MTTSNPLETIRTEAQAIDLLEKLRWNGSPLCPYCSNSKISPHASPDRDYQRWQCRECRKAFSVTVNTAFHGTRLPLTRWFLVISMLLSNDKNKTAYHISKDTSIRRATVSMIIQKVRSAAAKAKDHHDLLRLLLHQNEL